MRGRSLLVLAAVVAALAAFILLWERHQPTTGERAEQEDLVLEGLEREEVAALEVHRGEERVRVERRPDGWRLVAPLDWPADEAAVGGALTALLDLRAQRTLAPDEVDPAEYGLGEPALEVVLETVSGARERLAVGEPAALGSTVAVTRDGATVHLVPSWFTQDLERPVGDWRSRDVLALGPDEVSRLVVETPADRVEVVRDGDLWRLVDPVSDLAEPDHVHGLLSDLNALRVVEFPDETAAADPATLGLEPPRYRVVLEPAGGGAATVLELGATRDVDGATRVAARRDGGELLWVDDRPEIRLSRSPVTWRAKAPYPFDSWEVEALTLEHGDERVALERVDGMWRAADGTPADATAVLERLAGLAALEATAWGLPVPEGAPVASASLELEGRGGEARRSVRMRFFAPLHDGERRLVAVDGRPGTMALPAQAVDAVLADLSALTASAPAE